MGGVAPNDGVQGKRSLARMCGPNKYETEETLMTHDTVIQIIFTTYRPNAVLVSAKHHTNEQRIYERRTWAGQALQ